MWLDSPCGSVCHLYYYFTLYNASRTLWPCKTLLPHFSTHEMGPLQSCWRAPLGQTGWSVFQTREYAVIKNILTLVPAPIWTQHVTGPKHRPALKKLRFNSGGLVGKIQQRGLKPSISHSSSLDKHRRTSSAYSWDYREAQGSWCYVDMENSIEPAGAYPLLTKSVLLRERFGRGGDCLVPVLNQTARHL